MSTIHEETMRELCNGADWQHKYATNAAARAAELTALIDPAEERLTALRRETVELERQLTPLRRELGEAQQARLKHERLAADFREMARQQCQANGWDLPRPAAPEPPRDDLTDPPHGVSRKCFNGICKADPEACEGCEHDCHWLPAAEMAQEAEHTNPDPGPEEAEARAVRTPWALPLALYVRMQLAGRQSGHAGRWRVFKHRPVVEIV